jgi:hypothetical protein
MTNSDKILVAEVPVKGASGDPLSDATLALAKHADAILPRQAIRLTLSAVGANNKIGDAHDSEG